MSEYSKITHKKDISLVDEPCSPKGREILDRDSLLAVIFRLVMLAKKFLDISHCR
jgi:hypothetical protein